MNFLDGRLRLRQETVVNYGHDFFLSSMVLNLLTVSITSSRLIFASNPSSFKPSAFCHFWPLFDVSRPYRHLLEQNVSMRSMAVFFTLRECCRSLCVDRNKISFSKMLLCCFVNILSALLLSVDGS